MDGDHGRGPWKGTDFFTPPSSPSIREEGRSGHLSLNTSSRRRAGAREARGLDAPPARSTAELHCRRDPGALAARERADLGGVQMTATVRIALLAAVLLAGTSACGLATPTARLDGAVYAM